MRFLRTGLALGAGAIVGLAAMTPGAGAHVEDGQLVEKGHYIADGGSNIWGVEILSDAGQECVAASDRDHGLWILRYSG